MNTMKKMPKRMPEYKIIKSKGAPFPIKEEQPTGFFVWCEIMDYNDITWGRYVFPDRHRSAYTEVKAGTGVVVHGVGGAEITANEYGEEGHKEWSCAVQVTKEKDYYRILAKSCKGDEPDAVREYYTFLDDHSLTDWKESERQYGRELNVTAKDAIIRKGNNLIIKDDSVVCDVLGRYLVCIGDREFAAMCVIQLECDEKGIKQIVEKYIDRTGRTVMERYFERNRQLQKYYKEKGEIPYSEYLRVKGELFMHVADNISQYVL